jgi:DNA-binding CsgD family transcriptional regulator/class 3 adenylate cyclase
MPLFMDRHDLDWQTPEDVANAHLRDLEVQDKYDVKYLTYWLEERTIYCLVDAPSHDAAFRVHREAHGFVPADIIEVDYGTLQEYLGRVREPAPGEAWKANCFRTILAVRPDEVNGLIQRLGDSGAAAVLREFERLVRKAFDERGGSEVKRDGSVMLGCFPSVVGAVECALAVQSTFARPGSSVRVRIGVNAGEPVREHGELFGAAVELAVAISREAQSGQILASSVVHELCVGKNIVFDERGEAGLEGLTSQARVFEIAGKNTLTLEPDRPAGKELPNHLSEREVEVLRLVACGRTNQEIADQLVISINTVIRHVSNIFGKTGVVNRVEASSFARTHELI